MIVYFEVCLRCRNHGHYVFWNGVSYEISQEVMSQSDAIDLANEYRISGDISEEDSDALFKQVCQSGLPLVTASDIQILLDIEGRMEALMRRDPIIYPESWSDARRPVINIGEEICSFCQEVLSNSRPQLQ